MVYVKQVLSDAKAREKPCLRCELSLRAHLDEKFCPQCGLSVWLSLNANDSLEFSNPRWLKASARGTWLLAIAQVMALVAYVLAMVGSFEGIQREFRLVEQMREIESRQADAMSFEDEANAWAMRHQKPQPSVMVAASVVTMGAYFIVNAVAMTLMMANERRYPDRMRQVRLTSRVIAGVSAVVGVGLLIMSIPHLKEGWPSGTWRSGATLLVAEIVFVTSACCSWLWLRRIAQRGGHGRLGKLFGYLLFLPALVLIKAFPCVGAWFFLLLSPLLKFLPIAYIPLSVYLIARCGWILQKARSQAEAVWAKETRAV